MGRQLTFDLGFWPGMGRGDFFVSPANALALATLDAGGWPGGKLIVIGPEGAGKTHLATLWATEQGAAMVQAARLTPEAAPRLAAARAVVVEDAQHLAATPGAETALFHLHNLLAAESGRLVLTATTPPRDWGLALPDLASRVLAAASVRLQPPDDALLSAVMVKLFGDRQITVDPAIIAFLTSRMDRSLATARALVAELDLRAQQKGGPVTRALAIEALDSMS